MPVKQISINGPAPAHDEPEWTCDEDPGDEDDAGEQDEDTTA